METRQIAPDTPEASLEAELEAVAPKKKQRRPGPGRLRRDPQTGQVQAIPKDLKPAEVLQRYLTEQTTSQIAASYGVKRKSLIAWLRQVAPKEWKAVQLIRAHDMKDQGNEQLEVAADQLSLARAREIVRSAQWELQALDPDYRPKQEIAITEDDLGERLRRAKERVIDAVPQEIERQEETKS